MPKYLVRTPWHCSFLVEVEAENEKEALEKSWNHHPNICHQCSNEIELGDANDSCDPDVSEI